LTLDLEGILGLIDQFERESKALKKDILTQCWFMRGGLTYEEAIQLSREERSIINELINDNLETTKKTKMPFF
jgi:hypothetical protein